MKKPMDPWQKELNDAFIGGAALMALTLISAMLFLWAVCGVTFR